MRKRVKNGKNIRMSIIKYLHLEEMQEVLQSLKNMMVISITLKLPGIRKESIQLCIDDH